MLPTVERNTNAAAACEKLSCRDDTRNNAAISDASIGIAIFVSAEP